jgi:uncharacterized membrane protein YhiD involved in acid resistance
VSKLLVSIGSIAIIIISLVYIVRTMLVNEIVDKYEDKYREQFERYQEHIEDLENKITELEIELSEIEYVEDDETEDEEDNEQIIITEQSLF